MNQQPNFGGDPLMLNPQMGFGSAAGAYAPVNQADDVGRGGGGSPNAQPDVFSQGGPAASIQSTTAMNLAFFGASVSIVANSLIAAIAMFCTGQVVDTLEMVYFIAFGSVLGVLDTPVLKAIKFVEDMKFATQKYIHFLTRVTGKGVTFIFLSASLFCSMWTNLEAGLLLFFAVTLCFFAFCVGLAALTLGTMKSQKLNKARSHLAQGVLDNRYPFHATTFRGEEGGLTPQEFNNLTTENGGFRWEEADLRLIFNALTVHPAWRTAAAAAQPPQPKISKQDLQQWVVSGGVML